MKYLGNRLRSKRSEQKLARLVGGKVQPASGAINRADLKGDVTSDVFLFDDKVVSGKSFSVSVALFRKLRKEAWRVRKKPAIRVSFDEGPNVYVIEESEFLALLAHLRQQKD